MENGKEINKKSEKANADKSLTFPNNPGVRINPADIVCVFCDEPYLKILLNTGICPMVKERFKNLLERLDNGMFYKPHKSYIFSIDYAKLFFNYGIRGLMIELEFGEAIKKIVYVPVSKRNTPLFNIHMRLMKTITKIRPPNCTVHVFLGEAIA